MSTRPKGAAAARGGRHLPGPALRALHLLVLWSLGVAQPVFDLLGSNVEFFAARHATTTMMLTFVAGLVLAPFLVFLAITNGTRIAARTVHLERALMVVC